MADTPALMGRPPYVPTEEGRRIVEGMSAAGITQEGIARVMQISVETLVKYYREELDTALDKALVQVAGSLFKKAVSDDHPNAAACAMFFLKTRGRWRETNETVLSGPDSKAPAFVMNVIQRTP